MELGEAMQGPMEEVRPISALREQQTGMSPTVQIQLEVMGRGRRQCLRNAKQPLRGLLVIHRQFVYGCRGLGNIPLDQGGQRMKTTGIYV